MSCFSQPCSEIRLQRLCLNRKAIMMYRHRWLCLLRLVLAFYAGATTSRALAA